MQYALLIYDDEQAWAAMSDDERNAIFGEYGAYTEDMRAQGVYVDGAPLQSVTTATSIRVRDGEEIVTDGPFAETKEQLGGYYVVDVDTLDDAIAWAARIPSARLGTIEVRPVMPVGAPSS